jgi:hypothetical protein
LSSWLYVPFRLRRGYFLLHMAWLFFAPGTLAFDYPVMLIKSGAAQLSDAQTVLA